MKVLVFGNMMTEEGREILENAEKLVSSNPTVQSIIPLRQGLFNMFVKSNVDFDWASEFFEYTVSCIEKADLVVFLNGESEVNLAKGWIYGYCYAQGKPMIIIQDNESSTEVLLDTFASHSVLDTVGDLEDLTSYDFGELNTVYA